LELVEENDDDNDITHQYEDHGESETAVTTFEKRSLHMGPIPSPEVLAEYNEIDPTFANRILIMAEQQASHRQRTERKIIDSGTRDSFMGILFGFLIGAISLIVSLILGLNGRTLESTVLGAGGLGGLVSVFIYGTRNKSNENDDEK